MDAKNHLDKWDELYDKYTTLDSELNALNESDAEYYSKANEYNTIAAQLEKMQPDLERYESIVNEGLKEKH
jgi:hypothetical protein